MYSQRDPKWAQVTLGFGTTQTIGTDGCTITAIGNVIGVDPTVVNDRLKAVQGFVGALVIWKKIEEAFPGMTINRVWIYNNDAVKANTPSVIVEVPAQAIGGAGKHWVQFIGNQQCNDPWTGTVRPTSDFTKFGSPTGYCVLTGTWNKPQPEKSDREYRNQYNSEIITLCNLLKVNQDSPDRIALCQSAISDLQKRPTTCPRTYEPELNFIKNYIDSIH